MTTAKAPEETAPDLDRIEALALHAIAALPEAFRTLARAVQLRVAEFPDTAMLEELGIEDPFELTGLYEGTPLTEKTFDDPPRIPDTVWLFRRPILDEWIARGNVTLAELVTNVVVHELAHHFGWTDADIATIDRWWE